nr:hypothetical protein [Tanacetum cinerariifolium]
NDQFTPILGYGDLVQVNVMINRVYFVEGLDQNLFSVGQFCDANLEVAFRKSTCFVRDLQGTVRFGNDQFTLIFGYGDLVQGNVMINRVYFVEGLNQNLLSVGQFCNADLEVAFRKSTCFVRDLQDKMKEKGDQCILVRYSTQSKGYRVYNKRTRMIVESIHIRFDKIKEVSETSVANKTSGLVPQRQDVSSSADADVPSQQELNLLFGPLYNEFFNAGSNPSTNIQSTSAPSIHTNMHAEENNNDQAEDEEQLQDDEFTNHFCASVQEEAESSLHNIGNTNVPTFNQQQMDLKTDFLNGLLKEEVYVAQSDGFVDPDHLEKARYTLEILHKHGMDIGQSIGTPMATKPKLDVGLSGNPVDQADYHSKIGSLMYLTSSRPDVVQEYPKDSSFKLTAFSDTDHAGCIDSRKSTYGGIQFLGDKLVSWMSKKQNCTAMSSAKAKYVALSTSCAQVMWMRTKLQDYGFNYNKIPLYCDSQSAIAISCNPVQHSCTKHIHTRSYALSWKPYQRDSLNPPDHRNNDFAVVSGYKDVVIGSMTIKKVYYVEGLGHNLFSIGQFCDNGLEVAFRKSTCFVRIEDGVDLLTSIDYDEKFAPVARFETIRLFLAYATQKDFTVFQMDAKTAFLNGILKEEVYVGQPPDFVSTQYPDHVYALDKALYGLKQVPRA